MRAHAHILLSQPLDISGVYVRSIPAHFDRMDMTYIPYEPARFKNIVAKADGCKITLTDAELKACEEALMEEKNKERE